MDSNDILEVSFRSFCLGTFAYLRHVVLETLNEDLFLFCERVASCHDFSLRRSPDQSLMFACTRLVCLKENLRSGVPTFYELAETIWLIETVLAKVLQSPNVSLIIADLKIIFSKFTRSLCPQRLHVLPEAKVFIAETYFKLNHQACSGNLDVKASFALDGFVDERSCFAVCSADGKPHHIPAHETFSILDESDSSNDERAADESHVIKKICSEGSCIAEEWLKGESCTVSVTVEAFCTSSNIFSVFERDAQPFQKIASNLHRDSTFQERQKDSILREQETELLQENNSVLKERESSIINMLHSGLGDGEDSSEDFEKRRKIFVFGKSSPVVVGRVLAKFPANKAVILGKSYREILHQSEDERRHLSGIAHTIAKTITFIVWICDLSHDALQSIMAKEHVASFVSFVFSATAIVSVACECLSCKTALNLSDEGTWGKGVKCISLDEATSCSACKICCKNLDAEGNCDACSVKRARKVFDHVAPTERKKSALACALKIFTKLPPEFSFESSQLSCVPKFFVEHKLANAWYFLSDNASLIETQAMLKKFICSLKGGIASHSTKYLRHIVAMMFLEDEFFQTHRMKTILKDVEEAAFLLVASTIRTAYEKNFLQCLYDNLWKCIERKFSFTRVLADRLSNFLMEQDCDAVKGLLQDFPPELFGFPVFASGNGILHEACAAKVVPLISFLAQSNGCKCGLNTHGETVLTAVFSDPRKNPSIEQGLAMQTAVLQELSSAKLQSSHLDNNGLSVVVHSLRARNAEACDLLMKSGGVRFISAGGDTLLHYAAESLLKAETFPERHASEKNFACVRNFFDAHACLNTENQYNQSPLDHAFYRSCQKYMKLLQGKHRVEILSWLKQNISLLARLSESSTLSVTKCLEPHYCVSVIKEVPLAMEEPRIYDAVHLLVYYFFERSVFPSNCIYVPRKPRLLSSAITQNSLKNSALSRDPDLANAKLERVFKSASVSLNANDDKSSTFPNASGANLQNVCSADRVDLQEGNAGLNSSKVDDERKPDKEYAQSGLKRENGREYAQSGLSSNQQNFLPNLSTFEFQNAFTSKSKGADVQSSNVDLKTANNMKNSIVNLHLSIKTQNGGAKTRGLVVFIMYQEYGHLSPTIPWGRSLSDRGFTVEFWNSEAGHAICKTEGVEIMSRIVITQESCDRNGRRAWKVSFVNGKLCQLLKEAKPACVVFDTQLDFIGVVLQTLGILCVSCATNESEKMYRRKTEESAEELNRDSWGKVWEAEYEFLQTAQKIWHQFWDISEEEMDLICQRYHGIAFSKFLRQAVASSGGMSVVKKLFLYEDFHSKWTPEAVRVLDLISAKKKREVIYVQCPVLCRLEKFLSAYPNRLDKDLVFCASEGIDTWPPAVDRPHSADGRAHIYLCFGSQALHFRQALTHAEIFRDVFRKNPQWKVTISVGSSPEMKNCFHGISNVQCFDWLDQKAILSLGSVDVFVTHGGCSSVLEGIYYRVPLLVVPYAWDQFRNAKTVEILSTGQAVYQLNHENAETAIHSILEKGDAYRAVSTSLSIKMLERATLKCASSFIEQYIVLDELMRL